MITLLMYLLREHRQRTWIFALLLASFLWLSLAQALAEAPRMDTVLYGASY